MRAIIIGGSIQRTGKETGKQKFQTGETKQSPEEKENQIVQSDIEYADDTHLLIENDTHGQMCARIGNYDISTETRELKIQLGQSGTAETCDAQDKENIATPFWPDKAGKRRDHSRKRNKREWKPGKSGSSKNRKSAEHLGNS